MPEPEMNANGNVMVEALTPENVKGSSEGSINGGGHTMHTNSTFTSKWIGSVCSSRTTN